MIDSIIKFLNKIKEKQKKNVNSKDTAKERLHLVLMQDRANVSADFLELMKQEIIEVIKKYIEVDETSIDVRLTNKENNDGTTGAPALYANIPIMNIKEEAKNVDKNENTEQEKENKIEENMNDKDSKEEQRVEKNGMTNASEEKSVGPEIKEESKKIENEIKSVTQKKEEKITSKNKK